MTKQKKVDIAIIDHKNFAVQKKSLKNIIEKIISASKKEFKSLYVYFVDAEKLLELNKKFLNHNTDTDIITFSYSESEPFESEIYISFEMANRNAQKYHTKIKDEILRLIIHGILHTGGLTDKTAVQKAFMRKEEDRFLANLKNREFIEKMNLGLVSN